MTTSRAAAFEDAVLAGLVARAALMGNVLASVQISIGPLGDETQRNSIQSLSCSVDQDWAATGNIRRRELLRLRLAVQAEVAGAGATQIAAARDLVGAYMAEIETLLRDTDTADAGPTLGIEGLHNAQLDGYEEPYRGPGSQSSTRMEQRIVSITAESDLPR